MKPHTKKILKSYTSPKYIVMAGQLIEVNSGVNYKYDMNQRGFIAIIDQETMKADKNICLEGITRPEIHSIGNNYIAQVSQVKNN